MACSGRCLIRGLNCCCHDTTLDRVGIGSLPVPSLEHSPAARGTLTAEQDIAAGTKLRVVAWRQEFDGTEWLQLVVERFDMSRRPVGSFKSSWRRGV